MFGISTARLVVYGILALAVAGLLFTVRHELIEKGRNLVYAEDNAALVKAQKEQMARDAALVAQQKDYIANLQSAGVQIKETIRVVQAPCKNDGAGDPRLGSFDDWMRARQSPNSLPSGGGSPAKGTVR